MKTYESSGVQAKCQPSVRGFIVRVEQSASADVLYVTASADDIVAVDVEFLEREGAAFKLAARPGTWAQHGLDAELTEGLPVSVWVRPAWAHVLISPYDRRPVVWR
jgi:hypothetical protein